MKGPKIITRADWSARPSSGQLTRMSEYQGFIIHHTSGTAAVQRPDAIRAVRLMQRFHQMDRNWIDIGYNYLIDASGRIFEGRGSVDKHLARGAHSPGFNSTRVGISLLGCFHPPANNCADEPTEAQVASLVTLCKFLTVRYWIEAPILSGHRDHRATSCPGDKLYSMLPMIRTRIGRDLAVKIPKPVAS